MHVHVCQLHVHACLFIVAYIHCHSVKSTLAVFVQSFVLLLQFLFKALYYGTSAMEPSTPLTTSCLLSLRLLPKAFQNKTKKNTPSVHEPCLIHIMELFLINRMPQTSTQSEDAIDIRLPKMFREGHAVRIHKPRLFKRFPIKHIRMKIMASTKPTVPAVRNRSPSPPPLPRNYFPRMFRAGAGGGCAEGFGGGEGDGDDGRDKFSL